MYVAIQSHTHTHTHTHTANPNVRSNPGSKEVTPLHIAAGSGHLACLQLLVQLGGDIMARDVEQLTPVDYASVNGQDLCLKYLNDVLGNSSIYSMGILLCENKRFKETEEVCVLSS